MGNGLNNNKVDYVTSYKKSTFLIVFIIIAAFLAGCIYIIKDRLLDPIKGKTNNTNTVPLSSNYRLSGNGLEDFDLVFMQLENNNKNKVYSPLSIKYALEMLAEGADGNTRKELDNVIGDYQASIYPNTKNMSFANAMFIKNSYKDNIVSNYKDLLKTKYNAEITYDSFEKPDTLNNWISNKTLHLINNMFDDSIKNYDYFLVNALAIDMNWNYQLQCEFTKAGVPCISYYVNYDHEKYSEYIPSVYDGNYTKKAFDGGDEVKVASIGASINRYDIISDLGESTIRQTVRDEYQKYVDNGGETCGVTVTDYVNTYIKELGSNYNSFDKSTDFSLYTDDEVKVFAKDLQTYNNKTLQYVAVMPKNTKLADYLQNLKASDLTSLINNLKEVKLENFEEGYVTKITGTIPLFDFDYELSLMDDLKSLGIKSVFEAGQADLSKLTTAKDSYIASALHKANITFSNDGIKASAVTIMGGLGSAGDCYVDFSYDYDVPVKEINISFDKPYLFLIRDKSTGEVWFSGTVYNPSK